MTTWTVERLGRKGDGVAIAGESRALAALTLPGEVIEGEAEAGRIASPRIVTPAPERVRPPCPHYRACGGCSLMHGSDDFVKAWKVGVVTEALRAQGLCAPIAGVHVSPPRSRRRAVLSGRRTKKGALVGFHARASEVIVDIADCHVLRPRIQSALPLLRRLVVAGASRSGELSLTVTETPAGLDLAVTGGKPMQPALLQALAALADEGDLARLSWDGQPITRRPPALAMGRARVVPPPGSFLQATAEGEAALLAAVRSMVGGAGRVLDLFAGCGTFSLPLAETAEVHAVEGLAAPLQALDAAARQAPGLRRITTEVRDLARRPLLPDELGYDAIVIDPPRAGAEAQAHEIARAQVPMLAWVSCDPVTFARDARILAEGGYAIERLFVVDQFRWSPHVETVAEIRRR
ncbi:class I SAM-dependent RNA methyltransferase [Paracoccus sp. P2]|uniref:Class I SAM-dependent RNA methyltransferase n=1 Tax=Paracoccus pantotrophus TaxID=82367 RepID=A0A7H9BU41_PARPN|nr:class I SAM-dependent RNA methyltransferase [Paracoccus pantotrophus]MDF3852839.1 class I SAM-dependent RNA methyltransferase [Paracoccus pantotrophus]QLH14346.1 class I SAM-dependent RNA methyltransferase [Paracoccus pantotrophus]RDD96218.1 class I SAM-dependent RNA methyltransferase [Paracoccus pantotrophus]RNI18558.1 class I SAM-dependent RNA methyltransferase [Paracoccus pantotrophus]WGR64477.1 class I SAM-dependent RNA methyltransferase [Paracoccus pantotrophus]